MTGCWPAVVPAACAAAWAAVWLPVHLRAWHRQRALEAVFGPGYFDLTSDRRRGELWGALAFGAYHLPVAPLALLLPAGYRHNHPRVTMLLLIVAAGAGYSLTVRWLCGALGDG